MKLIKELLSFIEGHETFFIMTATFVSSCIIQAAPVKVYPLNWLKFLTIKAIKWIGEEMNKELTLQFSELQQEIKVLDTKFTEKTKTDDENRLKDLRWEILSFSDNVDKHFYKQEQFDHIFDSHESYDELIAKYEKTNGKVDRAMKKINEFYEIYRNDSNF